MPEFAELHEHARHLQVRAARIMLKPGCMGMFKPFIPMESLIADIHTISMLASSMDSKENDLLLVTYLQQHKKNGVITSASGELELFKRNALSGCYLFKWQAYTGAVYKPYIELFQRDLELIEIHPVDALEKKHIKECLLAFAHYASFVFENKEKAAYLELDRQFGHTIMRDIELVCARYNDDSEPAVGEAPLLHRLYNGAMSALGMI